MRLVRIATAAVVVLVVLNQTAHARQGFELYNLSCGANSPIDTFAYPISSSSGRIYQHPLGTNYAPTNAQISVDPDLEYDSYVAIGGGPSSALYSCPHPFSVVVAGEQRGHFAPPSTSIDNSDWSQPLRHDWMSTFPWGGPHAISSPGPGGNQAVFIGRITTDEGATLVYDKVYAGLKTECSGLLVGCHFKDDGTTITMDPYYPGGPAPVTEFIFRLVSYRLGPVSIPGFGSADIHNLYIEAYPNPEWVGDCDDPQPPRPPPPPPPPPPAEPLEPNNAFSQALAVGSDPALATLNDQYDYYRFATSSRGTVTFEATFENPLSVVGETRLYSPSGVLLEVADIVNGQVSISASGNRGDYVVVIERHAGNGRYWLAPSFTPDAPADTNADGHADARDAFNILSTWDTFIAAIGPGDINADLNGDYTVGRPDLEIVLRALGFDREDYTPKAWKKAMKTFYTRQIRPVESFPAGTTGRVANQTRKLMQQRLEAARP